MEATEPGEDPNRSLTDPTLGACASLAHAFLLRASGIDTGVSRTEALERLVPYYQRGMERLGFDWGQLQTAEQIHGVGLAHVDHPAGGMEALPGVDGLYTATPGVLLGILVADCCAVSLVDPSQRAIALLHSGKAGTEANITGKAIAMMASQFGSRPDHLIVHLSPCIRPPHYEIDFAAEIRSQAAEAGVPHQQIHDRGLCTASDSGRFYSYRREKGLTGRMLALLGYHAAR